MPLETKDCESTPQVSISFSDKKIASLFASILANRGYTTQILVDPSLAQELSKIITEPLFFDKLSESQKAHCLLIGHPSALKGRNALSIAQPLTEGKIERALSLLLKE